MPSYTSSSDRNILPGIIVPAQPWGRVTALAALLTLVVIGAWEFRVRSLGYGPSYDDTPGLWSMSRDRLHTLENPVVVVGDSRIRFDLDHDLTSKAFGGRPVVSLAMNGSVARPVLSMLAKDESFRGTVLLSYTPNLFWAPGGPNLDQTIDWISRHDKRTVAMKWGQRIGLLPDATLAFVEKDDLALGKLLRGLAAFPNRPGVRMPPKLPPYLCTVLLDRREVMWEKLEKDPAYQAQIQDVWRGLFGMAKPLPPDLLAKLRAGVIADIRAIQARGGEVILIAFPSTGWLNEWEEQTAPRATHWDPLIAESGCIGIHFKEHEELRDFDCPEWSHLIAADSVKFTERLLALIGKARGEKK